jgi:cyclopropane fatty-acyl-phospholipid synthase-like methyltransferase
MPYPRRRVRETYAEAAAHPEEHEKVLWSSPEAMENRFRLALRLLPFEPARTWLDVGCGTGAFQALVRGLHPRLACTALDFSAELLDYARSRAETRGVRFVHSDFLAFDGGPFDLLTCIGVLQKTTFTPAAFFAHARTLLVPGGRLFLDTKNICPPEAGGDPEADHECFPLETLLGECRASGFDLSTVSGFLPNENRLVPAGACETVVLVARAPGD